MAVLVAEWISGDLGSLGNSRLLHAVRSKWHAMALLQEIEEHGHYTLQSSTTLRGLAELPSRQSKHPARKPTLMATATCSADRDVKIDVPQLAFQASTSDIPSLTGADALSMSLKDSSQAHSTDRPKSGPADRGVHRQSTSGAHPTSISMCEAKGKSPMIVAITNSLLIPVCAFTVPAYAPMHSCVSDSSIVYQPRPFIYFRS